MFSLEIYWNITLVFKVYNKSNSTNNCRLRYHLKSVFICISSHYLMVEHFDENGSLFHCHQRSTGIRRNFENNHFLRHFRKISQKLWDILRPDFHVLQGNYVFLFSEIISSVRLIFRVSYILQSEHRVIQLSLLVWISVRFTKRSNIQVNRPTTVCSFFLPCKKMKHVLTVPNRFLKKESYNQESEFGWIKA